jgi:hypothetical protein
MAVLKEADVDFETSFQYFDSYFKKTVELNPGTITAFETTETGHFRRAFIMLDPAMEVRLLPGLSFFRFKSFFRGHNISFFSRVRVVLFLAFAHIV